MKSSTLKTARKRQKGKYSKKYLQRIGKKDWIFLLHEDLETQQEKEINTLKAKQAKGKNHIIYKKEENQTAVKYILKCDT